MTTFLDAAPVAAAGTWRCDTPLLLALQCPSCALPLGHLPYGGPAPLHARFRCANCSYLLADERGIWNALPDNRRRYYAKFLQEYQTVREAEGRGSNNALVYLALPFRDLTGRYPWQWKIRSRTFQCLTDAVLPVLERKTTASLRVLDLGAGNGWLSYRLALRGHRPVAVDLRTLSTDGLGAAVHYRRVLPALFPCFQAELDRLPFGDSQFDCAIYNASFHYSENYSRTLAEAIRCLRPRGAVIIADSPFYSNVESGERMVEERRADFARRFGFPSSSLESLEYLTRLRMEALELRFGIRWRTFEPRYGLRWALRRPVAKWKGNREPSRFAIYMAEVKSW